MTGPAEAPIGYDRLLSAGRPGAWRGVLGVAVLVLVVLLVAQLVLGLLFSLGIALAGGDVTAEMDRILSTDPVTPAGLAFLNLALASAIPATWLLVRVLHGLRPGWLGSVVGRLRWRWFATCLGLAAVTLLATLVVGSLVPASGDQAQVGDGLNSFTSTTRDFLLVILLLTPLQAAGEEYAFRGYLTQVFGLLGRRSISVLLPALLFALAHGAQDPAVFFDRFAFGVVAGVLVIATGGLEAGIAMHVLNNFVAYGVALAFGDMTTALDPSGGSWWSLPVTLTQSLLFLGLTTRAARRRELAVGADPVELVGPATRV